MPVKETVVATVTARSGATVASSRRPVPTLRSRPASRAPAAGGGIGTRRTATSATADSAAVAATATSAEKEAASTPASAGPATPATL